MPEGWRTVEDFVDLLAIQFNSDRAGTRADLLRVIQRHGGGTLTISRANEVACWALEEAVIPTESAPVQPRL